MKKINSTKELLEYLEKTNKEEICWDSISKSFHLISQIIFDYEDNFDLKKVTWNDLSCMKEELIERYSNYIGWDRISSEAKLSEDFIEKHIDEVNWENISENQNISEKFIKKHTKRICFDKLKKNYRLRNVSARFRLEKGLICKRVHLETELERIHKFLMKACNPEIMENMIKTYYKLNDDAYNKPKLDRLNKNYSEIYNFAVKNIKEKN